MIACEMTSAPVTTPIIERTVMSIARRFYLLVFAELTSVQTSILVGNAVFAAARAPSCRRQLRHEPA
jgi:hypothetical protein